MAAENENEKPVEGEAAAETQPQSVTPKKDDPPLLTALPTLQFYQKTYANSCGNNDAKAVKLFKEYESRDKVQRMKQELFAVSKGRAAEAICNKVIGLTRKSKYNGYDKWAVSVLMILNSKG